MKDFEKIKEDLLNQINSMKDGDFSDIGNEIGISVSKFMKNNDDKDLFMNALNHGISLGDGSH